MASTVSTSVEQGDLALSRKPNQVDIPLPMIWAKKTAGAAFTLACDASGLDDKEVYLALGIDKGYFSRMKSGTATLDADLIAAFCKTVGNHIYAEWIAYQVRCTLVVIQTEAERRAAEAEARAEAYAAENRLMRQLLSGRA